MMKNKCRWQGLVICILFVFFLFLFAHRLNSQAVLEGKLNINTATKQQLMLLPGIGSQKAESIIEYRKVHGNFTAVEDLLKVKGIGKGCLEKIRPYVILEGETTLKKISKQGKGSGRKGGSKKSCPKRK